MKLYEERLHQRCYSSSQIHKSMSRYKDIKILVALLPTLKSFLSVEINLEIIKAAARNCSLKKFLSKILKNSRKNTSAGVSFLKNKTKREKKETLAQVFSVNCAIFFRTLLLKVANGWLLLKAISRLTHQNLVNF